VTGRQRQPNAALSVRPIHEVKLPDGHPKKIIKVDDMRRFWPAMARAKPKIMPA
jgi:hypothetical protein